MKGLFYGITIYNAIIFILLFAYFPTVWLNLVFTFDYLDSADVPYYNNASSAYDRFNSMWWIIALDVMRFVGPAISSFALGLLLLDKNGMISTLLWYTIVMIILLILEAVKAAIFTWQWVYCSDYQLCRNFNPAGNPSNANYVFQIMVISDYLFFLFFVIYLGISSAMGKYARLKTVTSVYNDGFGGDEDNEKISVIHVGIPASDNKKNSYYKKYMSSIGALPEQSSKKKKRAH